ncbi:MAG: GDP-mannose 4,6-dehydratase [Fibrobacteria bacterium]|nr:GDP-mannose 4,6-dehydratase [Fibrobacteria bacterium]
MTETVGKILVTGAGGFVGSWMVRRLLDSGADVVAGVHNLRHDIDLGVETAVLDLDDASSVFTLIERVRPAGIVHLAGLASPHIANSRPEVAHRVNFLGTLRLLEACKSAKLGCPVVIAGSATVYGRVELDELPLRETQPLRPADHYSLSKAGQESLASLYSGEFPVMVARPFNHTGPGQVRDFALPAFAAQIARIESGRQEPVLHVGDLSAEREFLHVSDVVDAYAILLARRVSGTYNVCTGNALPMKAWLDRLVAQAKVPISITTDPRRVFPQGNPRLAGDSGRLRALGWSPRFTGDEILADLLAYWRSRIASGEE